MVISVARENVVAMLADEASKCGLSLRQFYELAKSDELDEPLLRDLWLIWGGSIIEEDLVDIS